MSRTYRHQKTYRQFFGDLETRADYDELIATSFYKLLTDNMTSDFSSSYKGYWRKVMNKQMRQEFNSQVRKCEEDIVIRKKCMFWWVDWP